MKKLKYFALLVLITFLSFGGYSQTIIASFENQKDLQNTHSTKGVDVSRSTDFAALGAYSCKAVFPENGGAFFLTNIKTFYQRNIENSRSNRNEVLLCFIWTNEVARVSLIVEDSLNQTFTKHYDLKQGANHLQLRLSDAKKLDLKQLKSVGIQTEKKHIFYLDYVALDQYQPVLDKLGRWEVEYSTAIETSHYPWGSELVSGSIKSYSISPIFDGRGIIELAERLDLDFDVTTIGRTPGAEKYGYGDFYMRRSPGHGGDSTTYNLAKNYIADDLLFNPEYDVIIWSGIHKWETYPRHVRNAVLDGV